MELKVSHDTVSINEVIFEGSAEQPVDLDINLPDYCPDISRILKCRLMPAVSVRQITGDRLQVEGKTQVVILYVDDTNRAGPVHGTVPSPSPKALPCRERLRTQLSSPAP